MTQISTYQLAELVLRKGKKVSKKARTRIKNRADGWSIRLSGVSLEDGVVGLVQLIKDQNDGITKDRTSEIGEITVTEHIPMTDSEALALVLKGASTPSERNNGVQLPPEVSAAADQVLAQSDRDRECLRQELLARLQQKYRTGQPAPPELPPQQAPPALEASGLSGQAQTAPDAKDQIDDQAAREGDALRTAAQSNSGRKRNNRNKRDEEPAELSRAEG